MGATQMPLVVLTDGRIIRLAEEKDAEAIVTYISKQKEQANQFIDSIACGKDHFDEVNICHNLYECNEEFLLFEENGHVQAMILFGINVQSFLRTAEVNAVFMHRLDEALLLQMFDFATCFLPAFSIIEPTRLSVRVENKQDEPSLWWQQAFLASGFAVEPLQADGLDNRQNRLTLIRYIVTP